MPPNKRPELWEEEARRLGGESLVQVITDIRDGQNTILERLDAMDERHTKQEQHIEELFGAFPAKDTDGHQRYHATMIAMLEERRKLRVAITEKTLSALVWSGIVTAAGLIWAGVKTKWF